MFISLANDVIIADASGSNLSVYNARASSPNGSVGNMASIPSFGSGGQLSGSDRPPFDVVCMGLGCVDIAGTYTIG